jgi:hypothetical protein
MSFTATWEPIERAEGPQQIPAWCGGAHVELQMEYANSPHVLMKQVANVAYGPWQRDGKEWTRTSLDGSLRDRYWHAGALTQLPDGSWETTRQEGFGGRTFKLGNVEGLGVVHLRGPWFGGDMEGYQEAHMVDMTRDNWDPYYADKPWYRRGACFGWYVRQTDLVNILSQYAPEMPLARVKLFRDWCSKVEPYLEEWGMPKDWFMKQQRADPVEGSEPKSHNVAA